ncbi:unnamed protein product [Rotaria sordida]|uniref:TIR domain-containing protein n=1 Tax=Rotaria sordida TaxID=392033 RepID=A0A813TA81_9BILA|nr:unnamed protein product [Rotaria sordida]CAF0806872.1 unnamed protein product [Rotaria sordida]
MTEYQSEMLSWNYGDGYENVDMEKIIQVFQDFVDNITLKTSEEMTKSDVVFQQLLNKFQQVRENEDNLQDLIHGTIPLCNEFIDTIEKVNFTCMNDFQNCLKLFRHIESVFQIIISMEDEKFLIREIFFALLNLLSKPQICFHLNDDQHTTIPHKEVYKCVTNLLLSLACRKITLVSFISDDSTTRKYTDILNAMYKRVERNLQLSTHTRQPTVPDNQTTFVILSFFWNLSDRTVIVPWLLDIGLVKTMLECLQRIEISSETAKQIINIIHNISRHDEGADELNKFHGLVILKNIQSNNSQALDELNNLLISMAIALLSTPKQIHSDNKRMNRILNQLLQITMEAAETEDHRDSYAFHVSEPLAVFTKLFVDDRSLEYVLSHAETDPQLDVISTINLFIDLFMKFRGAFVEKKQLEQFTCTALLNILWSISFQDRYKTKLQQNKGFMKTITSLAMDNGEKIVEEYVSRSMESMIKAANGILYNLNEISDDQNADIADRQLISNASCEKPMIMISYAHSNNHFCDKILAELKEKGNLFGIWIDRNYCLSNEDLWEKIALGIKQSNLVLCLLSQEYFNSKSCRKEAIFAIKRKKSIIPVYIGEPGDCDWLVAEMHEYALKLRKDSKKEFIKYEQRYAKNHDGEELEEYIFNRFKNAILNLPNSPNQTMKTSICSSQISTPKSSTCTIS